MAKKPFIVGYRRKHAKHTLQAQDNLFERNGVAKVYDDLDLCMRQRRVGSGDIVAVKRLLLLADPKRLRQKGGLRQSMMDVIWAFDAKGVSVWEIDTNRSTGEKAHREMLIMDNVDELAKTRASTNRTGRPKITFSPEQQIIICLHWKNLDHDTDGDAHKAILATGIKVSMKKVKEICGPSGRKGGPKSASAPKRARKT